MAYMTQEHKKTIAAALKVAMTKFPDVKYSLSVDNHSTLVCTISKGPEFMKPKNGENESVNTYWVDTHYAEQPQKLEVLQAIMKCMSIGYYDNSDIQTDYFDTAFYRDIKIGKWNKPFQVV